jgi:hypothetical protein
VDRGKDELAEEVEPSRSSTDGAQPGGRRKPRERSGRCQFHLRQQVKEKIRYLRELKGCLPSMRRTREFHREDAENAGRSSRCGGFDWQI